ncbi:hypothetical protein FGO68_gene1003 [Halteria grandinella]|uniref:Uncharacterized protein n=1 Tax=Halteria grandinella TaxID=5974 RepID=A0A8J8NMN3_HALGN|nr:hypothetical protein FGO68_gene1003 [Halteria grandinella]
MKYLACQIGQVSRKIYSNCQNVIVFRPYLTTAKYRGALPEVCQNLSFQQTLSNFVNLMHYTLLIYSIRYQQLIICTMLYISYQILVN